MNNEQEHPPFVIRNSQVVILGLARQGTALARFLVQAGAEVTVSDLRDEAALAGRWTGPTCCVSAEGCRWTRPSSSRRSGAPSR